jgi:LssY C-terminus
MTRGLTHHIGPNIDGDRDLLMRDFRQPRMVDAFFQISGTGPTLRARNGEGDPYDTNGEIDVARLVLDGVKRTEPPTMLPPPRWPKRRDRPIIIPGHDDAKLSS